MVKNGKILTIKSSNRIIDEDGNIEESANGIHIIGVSKSNNNDSEIIKLILALEKIKKFSETGTKEITIACMVKNMEDQIRKAVELVFRKETRHIRVKTKRKREENKIGNNKEGNIQKKKSRRTKETIIIKTDTNTYAETLKQIRKEIDVERMGIRVTSTQKTEEGHVKVNIKVGSKGNGQTLRKEVQNKLNNKIGVEVKRKEKQITILDIDEFTTEEEIRDTISREINLSNTQMKEIQIKLKEKATNRGRKYAQLRTRIEWANKLIEIGRLKMGWDRCRVVEQLGPIRCYKCQQFGHYAIQCKAEKKLEIEGKCKKCWKQGHLANECQNEVFCQTCGNDGHSNNDMLCPTYRKLINEMWRSSGASRKTQA